MTLLLLRNLALGLGAFALIVLVIAFRIAALKPPERQHGRPRATAERRLWRAFSAQLRTILSSMRFWVIAALITAAIIAGTIAAAW